MIGQSGTAVGVDRNTVFRLNQELLLPLEALVRVFVGWRDGVEAGLGVQIDIQSATVCSVLASLERPHGGSE